jgi:excisionase family DNA binding protein
MNVIYKKLDEIHQLMMEQAVLQKKILNMEEASKFVGISMSDLYKRTCTNRIPFHKPSGKLIYFLREDLESWMLTNRQESMDEMKLKASNFRLKVGRAI